MVATLYGILLLAKGETKKIKLKDNSSSEPLTTDSLQTIIKKKTPLSELGSYIYGVYRLTLFGYTSGKAGTENKHELPPPLDNKLFFSDILLIASPKEKTWKEPTNFTTELYQDFYTKAFGGFEDLEDEEDDEEESESDESGEEEEDEDYEDDSEADEDTNKNPELSKLNKLVKGKTKTLDEEEEPAEDDVAGEDESESDEFEEEEDEEEDEEDDVVSEVASEAEEVEDIKKNKKIAKKPSKKKNNRYSTILSQFNSKSKQSQFMKPGFEEIKEPQALAMTTGHEKNVRNILIQKIQSMFKSTFKQTEIEGLENVVMTTALREAETKDIIKHFDNPMFRDCYMVCARRILGNLNPNSYIKNEKLLPRVLSGDLTLDHIASMNVMDFAPSLYAGLREQMLLREKQQLEGNKAMATDMFKCGRCHKRECTFYEMQTRSADEPMTKFITCLNCGAHWRQ